MTGRDVLAFHIWRWVVGLIVLYIGMAVGNDANLAVGLVLVAVALFILTKAKEAPQWLHP